MKKLSSLSILYLSILAILIIAMGFLREFLFVNINYHLQFLYYHMERSYMAESLNFLRSFTYDELYKIKWILTILFTLVYLFFTCLVIKLLFHGKKCVLRTIYIFAAIIFISFIFYTSGYLINQDAIGYRLARICMGVVQSPLPLIILIPAFKLIKS
ncbi:hypothetical protein JYU16_00930 [bacterium AH-315-M05]|nr:hypothetical protein [bacterium AH-315-M05]